MNDTRDQLESTTTVNKPEKTEPLFVLPTCPIDGPFLPWQLFTMRLIPS